MVKNQSSQSAIVLSSLQNRQVLLFGTSSNSALHAKIAKRELRPVPCDQVLFQRINSETIVTEILDRRNELKRIVQKKEKILASNIDLALIVTAPAPPFDPSFVDRLLIGCEINSIKPVLVFNKCDLNSTSLESFKNLYSKLDVPTIEISAKTQRNLEKIISLIKAKKASSIILLGQSGVGKSSLVKALAPDSNPKISPLNKHQRGTQTTTKIYGYVMDYNQDGPIVLLDSPGIHTFSLHNLDPYSVKNYFHEFKLIETPCLYRDCLHIDEPDCAVKAALERSQISQSRYQSYISIIKEINEARPY